MTWVLVYLGSSLCLARHDWEFSAGSVSLTNMGMLEVLIHFPESQWQLMLMREMQSRAVMESTAVLLRVLITSFAGLALAQGKALGTKPRGVFAPAIRPSLLSQQEPRGILESSGVCLCLSWAGGRGWLLCFGCFEAGARWAVQRYLCSNLLFA